MSHIIRQYEHPFNMICISPYEVKHPPKLRRPTDAHYRHVHSGVETENPLAQYLKDHVKIAENTQTSVKTVSFHMKCVN